MGFRGRTTLPVVPIGAPTEDVTIGDPFITGGSGVAADARHGHAFPPPAPTVFGPGGVVDLSALYAPHDVAAFEALGTIDLSGYYDRLPAAAQAVRYVAANGADANDGVSPARAKATIASAVASLPATGGVVQLLYGTFNLAALVNVNATAGFVLRGLGPGLSTVHVNNGVVTTQGVVFNLTGPAATFVFEGLTIDGNGAGQTFTASGSNDYFMAISANGNNAGGAAANLIVRDVFLANFAMGATHPQGIGVNTFGSTTWSVTNLVTDNVDISLHITNAFPADPMFGFFEHIKAHNPNNAAILFEGSPSGPGGVVGSKVLSISDALSQADGIRVWTTNTIVNVHVSEVVVVNGRYPLMIGNAGTNAMLDSTFSKFTAKGCRGSYKLEQPDSSCVFEQLIAHTCAQGGVSGATVFGSFELGGGSASDLVHLYNSHAIGSAQAGIQMMGAAYVQGGSARNSAVGGNVAFTSNAVRQASRIRNVQTYNPVGNIASPALPGSATIFTNPFGVDCTVIVTGGTVTAIAIGGTATGLTAGAFRVPAGQTITVTYTVAPTWTWFGD